MKLLQGLQVEKIRYVFGHFLENLQKSSKWLQNENFASFAAVNMQLLTVYTLDAYLLC